MADLELLAKSNHDGSFSASVSAGELVRFAFVDFYNDATGSGYQRLESVRASRGREVGNYIRRCVENGLEPRLFEMTANARLGEDGWNFEPLDDGKVLGFLNLRVSDEKGWFCIIDGGTRLLGIGNALANSVIDATTTFDVRIFIGLSQAQEIAQFLLINEKQKKVRTDLSLRVVQRKLDDGNLTDEELKVLQTVVPEEDSWRFEASRIAGIMNSAHDSPWLGLIQMPNDEVKRPIKLQAFFTSLKTIITQPDIKALLDQMEKDGTLLVNGKKVERTQFITQVLKNFWNAVREVNPDAHIEPETTVLWGSIGANGCHIGLAPIIQSILMSTDRNLTQSRFKAMMAESTVAEYPYWFTKHGSKKPQDSYPGGKGEAPILTGAANYSRLGKRLEREWRAALHANVKKSAPVV